MNTDDLIADLVRELTPVTRLPNPWKRVVSWFAVSLPTIAVIVVAMGLRSDIEAKLADFWFTAQLLTALVTAVAAAYATFSSSIPGRASWLTYLPLVPAAAWLGVLGQQCLLAAPGTLGWVPDPMCIPAIAMAGAIPAVAIVIMARRGAVLFPFRTALLAGIAASAMGYFALRLFHYEDAALTVLVWQFGSVALLSGLFAVAGPRVFKNPFARA
jgi:hypothetical protein